MTWKNELENQTAIRVYTEQLARLHTDNKNLQDMVLKIRRVLLTLLKWAETATDPVGNMLPEEIEKEIERVSGWCMHIHRRAAFLDQARFI